MTEVWPGMGMGYRPLSSGWVGGEESQVEFVSNSVLGRIVFVLESVGFDPDVGLGSQADCNVAADSKRSCIYPE